MAGWESESILFDSRVLCGRVNVPSLLSTCSTRLPSNLRRHRPRMPAFSYANTRVHFRSRDKDGGHTIRSAVPENPMLHAARCSMFDRTEVIAYQSFTLREYVFSTLLAPVTLTLIRWPSYTNSICSPWKYAAWANMNFLRQGFWKLSSDRHTYRQTNMTKIIYHATSWVVNKILSMAQKKP